VHGDRRVVGKISKRSSANTDEDFAPSRSTPVSRTLPPRPVAETALCRSSLAKSGGAGAAKAETLASARTATHRNISIFR
jgi:hypothetical protein